MALTIVLEGQANLGVTTGIPATITLQMGTPGPAATVTVGTTTTGTPGSDASVVNVGTTSNAILDFTIPRGDQGVQGEQGEQGEQGVPGAKGDKGDTGAGVATGGAAGQALVKLSSDDFDTGWASINSAAWGNITGTLADQTDLQGVLDNKLSLTGGTMAAGALIDFAVDINGANSEIGAWGVGLNNTANYTATFEPNQLRLWDGDYTTGTSLTSQGISFNDATQQTTAALPLTGGTMSSAIDISYSDSLTTLQSSYVYTYQTNTGTNPSAYGVVYTGGFEAGDSEGKWIEFTPTQLRFGDGTIQTTAATGGSGSYLPLAGGLMSGAITFDSVGGQNINKGSFDSGRGGYNGISLNCAVGYELNWQAGYLKAINSSNAVVPINVDNSDLTLIKTIPSDIDYPEYTTTTTLTGIGILNSLTIPGNWSAGWGIGQDGVGGYGANSGVNTWQCGSAGVSGYDGTSNWGFGVTGVTFADSTVQTTAAVNPVGTYLPLAGGTMDGNIVLNNGGNLNEKENLITSNGTDGETGTWTLNFATSGDGLRLTQANSDDGYNNVGHYSPNVMSLAETVSGSSVSIIATGITFPDSSQQTTAASDWKAGGIAMFTNDDGNTCSYSLNFNGIDELLTLRLKGERDGSCMELYTTSGDDHGIRFYNYSNTLLNTLFNKDGVTFPDGSQQTTAAVVGEAPIDGNAYVRKNGAWVDITTL